MSLVYDGDSNRVSETVGGVTTKYLVDTLNPTHLPQVLDEIVNGAGTWTYAYGLQRISENQRGCPSIRAKALSRTKISYAVPKHRLFRQRG